MSKEQKEQILKEIMDTEPAVQDFITGVAVGIMQAKAQQEQQKRGEEA